jgi:hypothetical protein
MVEYSRLCRHLSYSPKEHLPHKLEAVTIWNKENLSNFFDEIYVVEDVIYMKKTFERNELVIPISNQFDEDLHFYEFQIEVREEIKRHKERNWY